LTVFTLAGLIKALCRRRAPVAFLPGLVLASAVFITALVLSNLLVFCSLPG
jgi:hypothetical protein